VRTLLSISLAGALAVVLGCASPASVTRTVDDSPRLAVARAPETAVLFVDGVEMGLAARFGEETPLKVIAGRHVVELRVAGQTVHRQEVYSGTGTTVTISGAQ